MKLERIASGNSLQVVTEELLQDPGARFLVEAASIQVRRRRIPIRVDDLGSTHVLLTPRAHIYVHDRMNRDLRRTGA